MRAKLVFFFFILFISCKINRTENGIPVGKWKYVSGTINDKTVVIGKYDKFGKEKGVWKYYTNDTLFRKEKYYYPYSVDVLFHKNGKISQVGKSITEESRWTKYGTWYRFDEAEQLIDSVTYEK